MSPSPSANPRIVLVSVKCRPSPLARPISGSVPGTGSSRTMRTPGALMPSSLKSSAVTCRLNATSPWSITSVRAAGEVSTTTRPPTSSTDVTLRQTPSGSPEVTPESTTSPGARRASWPVIPANVSVPSVSTRRRERNALSPSTSAPSATTSPVDGATPSRTRAAGHALCPQIPGVKAAPEEVQTAKRVAVEPAAAPVTTSPRPSPVTSPTPNRLVAGAPVAQVAGLAKALLLDRKTSSRPPRRHTASESPSLSTSPAARRARPAEYLPRQNVFLLKRDAPATKTSRCADVRVLPYSTTASSRPSPFASPTASWVRDQAYPRRADHTVDWRNFAPVETKRYSVAPLEPRAHSAITSSRPSRLTSPTAMRARDFANAPRREVQAVLCRARVPSLRYRSRRERDFPRSYRTMPSPMPSPLTSPATKVARETSNLPFLLRQSSTGVKAPSSATSWTSAAVLPPRSRSTRPSYRPAALVTVPAAAAGGVSAATSSATSRASANTAVARRWTGR